MRTVESEIIRREEKRKTNKKILEKLAGETFRYYCPICKDWFDEMTNVTAKIHRQMCLAKNNKGGK